MHNLMRTYLDLLETFDSPVEMQVTKSTGDQFTTKSVINGRTIIFNSIGHTQDNKTIWEIEFIEKKPGNATYSKTGSGSELQVFSFVIDSVKELIARHQPDQIVFDSHKADGNRSSLYSRLLKRIAIPNYALDNVKSDNYSDTFTIVRTA